jgi:hypothetical protein
MSIAEIRQQRVESNEGNTEIIQGKWVCMWVWVCMCVFCGGLWVSGLSVRVGEVSKVWWEGVVNMDQCNVEFDVWWRTGCSR